MRKTRARGRRPPQRRRGCVGAPGRRAGRELWFVLALSCPVGVASGEGQRLRRDGGAWMEVFKTLGRKSRVRTLCEGSRGRVCGIGEETRWGRGKDRARETRRAAGSRPEEAA